MTFDRRSFLKVGGLAAIAVGAPACTRSSNQRAEEPQTKPDYTIHIATGLIER